MKKIARILLILHLTTPSILLGQVTPPQLGLPWPVGESRCIMYGPHRNWDQGTDQDWSALDFATIPGGDSSVVAAAGGTVVYSWCHKVVIEHDNKWYTGYYHLVNRAVSVGDKISQGTLIGYSSEVICDGQGGTDRNHVHFTLRQGSENNHYPIEDISIGGYIPYIHGTTERSGGMKRGHIDIPQTHAFSWGSTIYNDGTIGTQHMDRFKIWGSFTGDRKICVVARNDIKANCILNNGNQVWLYSGGSIIFQPGFKANVGAKVVALSQNSLPSSLNPALDEPLLKHSEENSIDLNYNHVLLYPNPFFNDLNISYAVKIESMVQISIYDIHGKLINTLLKNTVPQGEYETRWNGLNSSNDITPAGMYICTIQIGSDISTHKIFKL